MGLFGGRKEVEPRPEQRWDAIVSIIIDLRRLEDYTTNNIYLNRVLETLGLLPFGPLWLMATFTSVFFFL